MHPGPALLREAAARMCEDRTAEPTPQCVRREIRACLVAHLDVPTLLADDIEAATWDLFVRVWDADEWVTYRTIEGWAHELVHAARVYEAVGL